jgi:hemerythrin-like domain-containing protein
MNKQLEAGSRRQFVIRAGALLGAAALLGTAPLGAAEKIEESPTEDLMKEHGVLRRVMLIFEDLAGKLLGSADIAPDPLNQAARLIRSFIQDYHEKDEEDYLFPRFEKAGKMVDLVKILRSQHQAGRKLIDYLERRTNAGDLKNLEGRRRIRETLNSFNRMYRQHAAREDTVLYPAFRGLVSPKEFEALGDAFEDKEEKLFGKNGFERIVAQVAGLEQQLGLSDLAQFTPKGQ